MKNEVSVNAIYSGLRIDLNDERPTEPHLAILIPVGNDPHGMSYRIWSLSEVANWEKEVASLSESYTSFLAMKVFPAKIKIKKEVCISFDGDESKPSFPGSASCCGRT